MNIPDDAVLVVAFTTFMIYAGVPLAKVVYEAIFGYPIGQRGNEK